MEGIVDEKHGFKLCHDACARRGLMRTTGGDLNRYLELRVGELAESVLTLLTLAQLFHGLPVYGFFDLLRYCLFGGGLPDSFCIAKSNSALNTMSDKPIRGCVTQSLQRLCRN